MSTNWNFAYVLPNARFSEPIENEWLALVPYCDPRFEELSFNSVAVEKLREGFRDQFDRQVQPSALLIRDGAPQSVDLYAALSFRNAIAISSVIDAWSHKISGGKGGFPLWTDYFDFYRFTATRDGNAMIARSLATVSLDSPDYFHGQSHPHLASGNAISIGIDHEVLDFLLWHWRQGFNRKSMPRQTRVVLRSLEIAFQAARMPSVGSQGITIHDMGVSIGLWVSAFEILTHPKKGNANLGTVVKCLGKIKMRNPKVNAKRYKLKYDGKWYRVSFIERLYKSLYDSRNDFMHGNKVKESSTYPFKKPKLPHLPACAALLYRIALAGVATSKTSKSSTDIRAELEQQFMKLLRSGPFQNAIDALYKNSR